MAVTKPLEDFDIGDQVALHWTYTPVITGATTKVEAYPPDGAAKISYTLATGIVAETPDHYRLYVPQTVGGPWEAYISIIDTTGETTGMERATWWTRSRKTP